MYIINNKYRNKYLKKSYIVKIIIQHRANIKKIYIVMVLIVVIVINKFILTAYVKIK